MWKHRVATLLSLILTAPCAGANEREVDPPLYKCVEEDGRVIYQDRSCRPGQVTGAITGDRTNTLPLRIPQEELNEISRLRRERAVERRRETARRDRAIRQIVQEHDEKRASCARAREEYRKVLRFRRRHGYVNAEEETIWLGRMRASCSD